VSFSVAVSPHRAVSAGKFTVCDEPEVCCVFVEMFWAHDDSDFSDIEMRTVSNPESGADDVVPLSQESEHGPMEDVLLFCLYNICCCTCRSPPIYFRCIGPGVSSAYSSHG
jgi:hypothetical protein